MAVTPEVVIIYIPDEQAHIFGAHINKKGWSYSGPIYLPRAEINKFIGEVMEDGYAALDTRLQANLIKKGMGKATPILLWRGVTAIQAGEAAAQLHQAILDS